MIYVAGESATLGFVTNDSTGAAAAADSTPTAALYKNGTIDNAVNVTVASVSTGAYKASFTVPSSGYSVGDEIELLIAATVGGIAAKKWIGWGKVDVLANTVRTTIPSVGNIQAGTSLVDLAYMLTGAGTSTPQFTADALDLAPTGGGGGGSTRLLATPLKSGRIEPVRYTRGATGPDLRDWVTDGSGNRLDITGYTVTATMIRVGTEGIVFEDEAATLGAAPTEGQVELEWPAGALDAVGEFRLIWSLASGGEVLTLSTLVVVE
jgi:hypothetical protein